MNIGTACCRRPDCSDRECEGRPDLLAQAAASGQMDARQQYEHERAGELLIGDRHAGIVGFSPGELDGIGVEAADAPRVTGLVPPIVTTELRPVRKTLAVDWQGVVIYGGVIACMFALAWLSTADPRDLSSFWPRILAALSL